MIDDDVNVFFNMNIFILHLSTLNTQHSTLNTQHSTLNTSHLSSPLITQKKILAQLNLNLKKFNLNLNQ